MTSVTDLNDNTLTLLESGIRSSSGASITFTRDRLEDQLDYRSSR